MDIKANTCPYCGSPYTLADGGCRAKCAQSERVRMLLREALDDEEAEDNERVRCGLPHRER